MSSDGPDSNVKLFRAACIQMNSSDLVAQNLRSAKHLLTALLSEQAKQGHKLDLVVFPENFLHFGISEQNAVNIDYLLADFKLIAEQNELAIVLGSMPVYSNVDDSRAYSRCFVVDAQGELVAQYDKVHLFDVDVDDRHGSYRESDTFMAGNELVVCSLNLAGGRTVKLGLSICFDLRFPEHYLELAKNGAEIVVVPSAFTYTTGEAHWELLLRSRAIENQLYVLAANQEGVHSRGRETWGHSMIVGPWGEILAECKSGESACVANLDFEKMKQIRKNMKLR